MVRLIVAMLLAAALQDGPAPDFFTTPYAADEMRDKQAVIETSLGTLVVDLLPDAAPNHVGFFMTQAAAGEYDGTLFHLVVRHGIILGGDPLTRDPEHPELYGSGGLNRLRFEPGGEKNVAGSLAAALAGGERDSGGAQFFISVTDQPGLDGQYTIFGRVVEGIEVVQAISEVDADPDGRPLSPVTIASVVIRDTPPEPFVDDTPEELADYRVVLETTMGAIELGMMPDVAPETVRQFLRLSEAGIYDGILVHRVARDFVIQTGALAHRDEPLLMTQYELVHDLEPEFSDTPNEFGVVSMARGDDPASASTSFFICIGDCSALTGVYTVFGRVTGGLDVVEAVAAVEVDGETPLMPVRINQARVLAAEE